MRRKPAEEGDGNNARSPSKPQVKALSQPQGYGIESQPRVLPGSFPSRSSPSPISSLPRRPSAGGGTVNGKGDGLKPAQSRMTNGGDPRLSGGRKQPGPRSEDSGGSTRESVQTRSGQAVTQSGASMAQPQSSPRRGFDLAKAPVSGHISFPARPGRGAQAEVELFLRPSTRAPSQFSPTHRNVDNDAPRLKSPPGLQGPVPPIRKNGESSNSSYKSAPRQIVPDRNLNSPKPNPTPPNRDFSEEDRNPTRPRAMKINRTSALHGGDKVPTNVPVKRIPGARLPSRDSTPPTRDDGSDGAPKSSRGPQARPPVVPTTTTTTKKASNSLPPKPLTSPLSDGPKIGSKDATPSREYRFTPLPEPTATDGASAVDDAMWDLADVDQETLARQLRKEAGIMIVDEDTIVETNSKIRKTALWAEGIYERRIKLKDRKRMARSRANQNNGLAESDEGDQKGGFGGQEMEEESEYGGETFGSSAPQRISRDELMAQGMEGTALEPLKEVTRQKVDRGDAERRRHSNADGSEAQEQRKTPSPSYSGTTDGAASLPGSSRSAPMDDDAEGSAISSTLARTRQGLGPAVPTTSTDRDELAGAMFASDNSYEEGIEGESAGSQGDTPNTSGGITLRPYQHAAIQACVDAFDSGLSRIGVSSPTGSGKTTMFMKLIPKVVEKQLGDKVERKQTLIIVNSVELARQSKNAAERLLPEGWTVEVEQGSSIASGRADVTIATYQTLTRSDRVLKFDPERFGLVIVDEAHHAAARSYLQILHYFHEDTTLPSDVVPYGQGHSHNRRTPIVGFSATFTRPDQLALSAAFEKIVYHAEIATMLKAGWLAPAKWTTVKADLDLSTVEVSSTGDYSTNSLAAHLDTPLVNQLIVRTYLHLASERRSTLVFCVNLTHVDNLVSEFRQAGVDARSVSSTSKPKDRRETLEKFMEGGFPVLVNCEVLTEGTDIPVIDCVITARPTRSINLLAQMVGRGLRLSPETGKTDCHVIDIADNLSRGLTITPTLLGLSSDEVDEVSVDEVSEQKDRPETDGKPDRASGKKVDEETNYQVTFVDESDPFGISKKPGEGSDYIPIQKITPNAWVACGDGKYVLEKFDSDYVKVSPNKHLHKTAKFAITDHTKNEEGWNLGRHYSKVKVVGYADTVDRALQTGDAYVTNQLGRDMAVQLRRSAQWRHRPATERQIAMIRTAKGVTEVADEGKIQTVKLLGKVVDLKKLTAGAVAAWISASKHGAFTVRKKNDRKAAQEEIKLQKRQEKEQEKAAREEAKMQKQQDKFTAKVQQQKAPKDLPFPVSYEYVGKVGTEGE